MEGTFTVETLVVCDFVIEKFCTDIVRLHYVTPVFTILVDLYSEKFLCLIGSLNM